MRTDDVRFAILKSLSLGPSHGYNLFQQLKDEYEIKNPSELYKLLRTMKDEGLIKVLSADTSTGREREILELSQDGFEAYYESLFLASRKFFDLISETAIRRISEIAIRQVSADTRLRDRIVAAESILLDLSLPLERQLQILNQIYRNFVKSPVVYVRTRGIPANDPLLAKSIQSVRFIDENLALKPQSIDLMLMLGPVLKDTFSGKPGPDQGMLYTLKPDAILVVATMREDLRFLTPNLLQGIENLFKDLFDEPVATKLQESLSQLLFSGLLYNDKTSNTDITNILGTHFNTVQRLDYTSGNVRSIFDIFIAQEPVT